MIMDLERWGEFGNCSAREDLGSDDCFMLVGAELGLRHGACRIGMIVDLKQWGEMENCSAGEDVGCGDQFVLVGGGAWTPWPNRQGEQHGLWPELQHGTPRRHGERRKSSGPAARDSGQH